MRLSSLFFCVYVLLPLVSANAVAHGRAAYSVSVAPHPTDGRVLVGTTYGLLRSDAAGKFHWICEQAPGYPDQIDPKLLWAKDGTMFAALPDKLARSTDDGCSWTDVAAFSATGTAGILEDPTAAGTYWVTTQKYGQQNGLFKSTDGVSFTVTSLSRPSTYFSAAFVAPSNGQRLYASAWFNEPLAAWLFTSNDRGATFTETTPTLPGVSGFKLIGVSPLSADVLFATVYDAQAQALVIRSTDGGANWVTLITTDDAIRGMHFSSDGHTAFIASARRLYRSTDDGASFTEATGWSTNACIGGRDDELFTCGRPPANGFVVGTFSLSNSTVTPKLVANEEVEGPLECPSGTTGGDVCPAQWPLTAPLLGAPLSRPKADAGEGGGAGGGDVDPRDATCGCGSTSPWLLGLLPLLLRRRR